MPQAQRSQDLCRQWGFGLGTETVSCALAEWEQESMRPAAGREPQSGSTGGTGSQGELEAPLVLAIVQELALTHVVPTSWGSVGPVTLIKNSPE